MTDIEAAGILASAYHEAGHAVARMEVERGRRFRDLGVRHLAVHPGGVDRGDGVVLTGQAEIQRYVLCPEIILGMPGLAPRRRTEIRRDVWRDALVYLAGPVAEALHLGEEEDIAGYVWDLYYDHQEDTYDNHDMGRVEVCLDLLRRTRGRRLDDAAGAVEALLRLRWPAVAAVAGVLAERLELDGREAEVIAQAAMPGVFPHLAD